MRHSASMNKYRQEIKNSDPHVSGVLLKMAKLMDVILVIVQFYFVISDKVSYNPITIQ